MEFNSGKCEVKLCENKAGQYLHSKRSGPIECCRIGMPKGAGVEFHESDDKSRLEGW